MQPPSAPVVDAPDELDAGTARDLVNRAVDALAASGASSVVVDLSYTTFVDSTGLGALVDINRAVSERGGRLLLRHPDERMNNLLQIAGLGEAFEIEQ